MKRYCSFALSVLLLAGVLLLVLGNEAPAQRKRGKQETEAGRKTGEEQSERKAADKAGEEERAATEREKSGRVDTVEGIERKASDPYRPRKLKQDELREWKGGVPPGWMRGEKKGWGDAGGPPGLRRQDAARGRAPRSLPPAAKDWGRKEREDWERRLERARERVREKARRSEGADEADVESAIISVEEAAREGVPIEHAEKSVGRALEAGMTGYEIEQVTRALAYGADKNADYDELDLFMAERVESGERGEDLAGSIYREIDRRQEARPEEPAQPREEKKAAWWNRIFRRE